MGMLVACSTVRRALPTSTSRSRRRGTSPTRRAWPSGVTLHPQNTLHSQDDGEDLLSPGAGRGGGGRESADADSNTTFIYVHLTFPSDHSVDDDSFDASSPLPSSSSVQSGRTDGDANPALLPPHSSLRKTRTGRIHIRRSPNAYVASPGKAWPCVQVEVSFIATSSAPSVGPIPASLTSTDLSSSE